MARSQLLKDVVSGNESIENILLRLKVVLSDLNNESIMNWVDGELQGYNKGEVPGYRILKGRATGTFFVNGLTEYNDASVPLEFLLPKEKIDTLITLHVTDSISAIQNLLNGENKENYSKQIPTAYCHMISTEELQIAGMRIKFASTQLDGIISNVKTKLVDIIMELEKQFDNLDDLDISEQVEESSIREQVIYNIEQIIYDDDSIQVGHKNKFSKSKLGNLFGGGKK